MMPVFGGGGLTLKQRPQDRRRSAIADQLLSQGTQSGPVGHPLEAAARVAQALSGAFIGKKLEEKGQEREEAAQQALENAFGTQAADGGGLGGAGPSQEAIAQGLLRNPDTSQFGFQMLMNQNQSRQDLRNQLKAAREKQRLNPPTRTFKRDGTEVFQQLNPDTGQFEDVSSSGIGVVSDEALQQKRDIAGAGRAQNIGTIPPGFQVVQEGNTISMVPIPGSPAAQEVIAGEEQTEARQTQERRQANIVIEDIGRARDVIKGAVLPTTGTAGELLSGVGGTASRDLSALLDTIKSNVGFDKLQQMRNASPTGGALGQVSERENILLQSTLGNLEQSQSEEQFLFNMDRLENVYLDSIHGPGEGPKRKQLGEPPSTSDGSAEKGFTVRKVR